jgi:D-lactate dehydrogenase (cytochrome)
MQENLIKKFSQEHEDYLKDESRIIGQADSISFPKTEDELKEILSVLKNNETKITIQGARTGVTGGASPKTGHILNFSRMNKIKGLRYDPESRNYFLKVQPGVLLSEIRQALISKEFDTESWSQESLTALIRFQQDKEYFFPPDPTESSASIGGMVSCNASGARTFQYGPIRKYVEGLRIFLVDGDSFILKRGKEKAKERFFKIKTDQGKIIKGKLPSYYIPKVKNASGYYVEDDMDLVDLFIGSEGTLGMIVEIEIKLVPKPACIYGLTVFASNENIALRFVHKIRDYAFKPAAIEYFNANSLNLLRDQRKKNSAFSTLLAIPIHFSTAVYVEYHGEEKDVIDKILKAGEVFISCGGSESDTWLALNSQAMEQLHFFRHAVPEAVNLTIDERRKNEPSLTKLGTDMAVSDDMLENVMILYNTTLEESELDSVIFGHIGNNHVHINILPRNAEDYKKGKNLYLKWAEEVLKMGGTVSAEHGIGKMKVSLLKKMLKDEGIHEMQSIKKLFDQDNRLNIGNLFEI